VSRKSIGLLILLVASELLGLLLGQWFYSLFIKTLPPLALSSFNQGTAHVAFLVYGSIAGVAVFFRGVARDLAGTFLRRATGTRPGCKNRSPLISSPAPAPERSGTCFAPHRVSL